MVCYVLVELLHWSATGNMAEARKCYGAQEVNRMQNRSYLADCQHCIRQGVYCQAVNGIFPWCLLSTVTTVLACGATAAVLTNSMCMHERQASI